MNHCLQSIECFCLLTEMGMPLQLGQCIVIVGLDEDYSAAPLCFDWESGRKKMYVL